MSGPTNARSHLSIGEVLSLLRTEFPDVTISKIRFLESQGLLDPERTPSGYRKFYNADIKRLRWILYQQKEHYLPLKVIKERLDDAGRGLSHGDDDAEHTGVDRSGQQRLHGVDPQRRVTSSTPAPAGAGAAPPSEDAPPMAQHNGHLGNGAAGHQTASQMMLQQAQMRNTNRAAGSAQHEAPPASHASGHAGGEEALDTARDDADPETVDLSVDELADASGLLVRDIRQLERFGLIEPRDIGGERVYDADALTVARVAAGFMQHGIEARHMRTYRVVVDREASLFEQIVLPVLKRRNPEARKRAAGTVAELINLGDAMRGILLQHELRDYLNGGD